MRLRDHYDWIVLGDDPGALLSASLAAKLGLSVLVLPLHPSSSLRISGAEDRSDETVLDLETNYIPGLGKGGLWDACLAQAGMTAQEQVQILSAAAVPQVVTPRRRVSLEPDRGRLASEFDRELGAEASEHSGLVAALKRADPAIERFWLDLPDRLTLRASRAEVGQTSDDRETKTTTKPSSNMTLSKLSDQLARSCEREQSAAKAWFSDRVSFNRWRSGFPHLDLGELCEGVQAAVTSAQGSLDADLFSLLHLLALSGSAAAFQGGMGAFREFLLRLARRNGADLPPKTECRQIFIQSGRFAGVLPSIRGSMIGATGGVLGVPLEYVQSMLTQSGRGWVRRFKTSSRASGWTFTIALTLHPEAIPPGMARRVIWQEKGAPFLEIERVYPSEYGLKDRHRVILFLRTLMPMTEESLTPEYQRLMGARLLRKATEISPFLEYHIKKIFPDFRAESGRELHEIYGFKALSDIPPHLLCYSGEGIGAHSGIEGLFLSSKESFPYMGQHGGVVSALEGVAWVAHRSGLAGPFKA